MRSLFELISRHDLEPDSVDSTLARWTCDSINTFIIESTELVAKEEASLDSPFAFIANSQLSGAPMPCSSFECRLKHADRMARFATLYSDQVVIQNPLFEMVAATSETLEWHRFILHGSLQMLWHLQPLMEAGVVAVTNPAIAFCEKHLPDLITSGRLEQLRSELSSTYSGGLKIGFDPADGSFAVDGPTSLLEHPMYGFPIELGPGRVGRADLRKDSTPDEATKNEIVSSIIAPILTDIVHQQVLGAGSQARYLTDRDVDFLALRRATIPELQELSQAITEGLSHAIPTLEDVSLTDLLRLRREEGEAFLVYRDALAGVLRTLKPADASHVREAFQDAVLPELHRIDAVVAKTRKTLKGAAATDLLFGVGVVTVGLFSGLLSADASQLIAQLGGTSFGVRLLQRLNDLQKEPAEARDNSYYFLWKARQHAERRGK